VNFDAQIVYIEIMPGDVLASAHTYSHHVDRSMSEYLNRTPDYDSNRELTKHTSLDSILIRDRSLGHDGLDLRNDSDFLNEKSLEIMEKLAKHRAMRGNERTQSGGDERKVLEDIVT
jgi:hypothetical protein